MTQELPAKIPYRKGRRVLGYIHTLPSGAQVYLARQTARAEWRGDCKTSLEARKKGIAGWMIEYETLLAMRQKGVVAVGIRVEDRGEIYLAHLTTWLRKGRLNNSGTKQLLTLPHLRMKRGKLNLR